MRSLVTVLITAALISGCAGVRTYLPIIDASLIGGRGVVQATQDRTVSRKDVTGCYATSALLTALDTTKVTLDSWAAGNVGSKVIPGVEVDLSACHALADAIKPALKADVRSTLKGVLPTVLGVLMAVLRSSDVSCRDLVLAEGVMEYVGNTALIVVEELAHPDGKMTFPAVTLSFSKCTATPTIPPQVP